jgi:RNA methyltransferase, RsmD family
MRVIAGKARSIPLKTPKNLRTRPTSDRIKETLFNMLQPDLTGCMFLDLFSGSGGIGIEALSRGAKSCVFVDNDRDAINCLRDNLEKTKMVQDAQIINRDVVTALRLLDGKTVFDCIFMDPPYDKDIEKDVLNYLIKSKLIHEATLIVVEASIDTDFDYLDEMEYEQVKEKKYKTNQHLFIKRK